MLKIISKDIFFWSAWIIIPLLFEIIPSICNFIILIRKSLFKKQIKKDVLLSEITLIIPVYNSSKTLKGCIESVYLSSYPNELITIYLVNNQSTDDSFKIFCECQNDYPELNMQWLNSKQGKSKALNMAVFNSVGKYIINIDSDGKLEKNALYNIVKRFEEDSKADCLTGAILIDHELLEETRKFSLKVLRKCEYYEYAQAFLAGRNFESEVDSIFTVSGAFSAFRKSTLLKTQLYNTDTVCEDAHVTFQVRKLLKKKVNLCENALFFVDPIDNFNKLYTQRQRWQRGEIEVAHMFLTNDLKRPSSLLNNFFFRLILFDHTFAFPRMIWYFALIALAFMNYPMKLILGSVIVLYILYTFAAYLFAFNIIFYLKGFKDIKRYYLKHILMIMILPLYNFIVFWIRFAGIINAIRNNSAWRTLTLNEEIDSIKNIIKKDFCFITKFINKIRKIFNYQ